MSLHPSLKMDKAGAQQRSVLSRIERIKELMKKGLWTGSQVTALPKTKVLKVKAKKKAVKKEGEGANWWCVLYPPLCFLDFSNGVAVSDGFEEKHVAKAETVSEKEQQVERQTEEAERYALPLHSYSKNYARLM